DACRFEPAGARRPPSQPLRLNSTTFCSRRPLAFGRANEHAIMTDTPDDPENEVIENPAEKPVERPRRTLSLGGSRTPAPVEAEPEVHEAPATEIDDGGVDTTAEDDEDDDGEPIVPNGRITLQELNEKTPEDLVAFAEGLDIENAGNLRKQDLLFAILKTLADEEVEIIASGVLEILPDGFGFLRSPDANYLPGPDDVY